MKTFDIYLSGMISDGGTKESTFERFGEAEEKFTKQGYEVFNPASLEEETEKTWEYYLARDLKVIYENRPKMFMLVGWEQSKGARLEWEFAKLLKLEIEYEK